MGRLRFAVTLAMTALAANMARSQPAPVPVPSVQPRAVEVGVPESPPVMSLEDRLQLLEIQNQQLRAELSQLSQKQDALSRVTTGPNPGGGPINEAPIQNNPMQLGRPIAQSLDSIQTGDDNLPRARVDLTQGVRLLSPDGRYRIEFHNLTQFDGRFFSPAGDPLTNQFIVPRQRFVFAGQVDKYFDFFYSTQRGYGTFDIFDAFINFKFDPAFNVRVGRTKTPYTYEYYKIGEGDLIGPERSVFVGNLSPNRQVGVMAYGRTLNDQLEYALGLFDGPHRSFQDFNTFKNPFLFLNSRPFLYGSSDALRYLAIGGSANYGREKDILEPNAFRTANDETVAEAVASSSPTFLRFNPAASIVGEQAFWSGDVNWFYRSLTVQGQYNGGFINYSVPQGRNTFVQRVPYTGGSFAVTYFLTGEENINRREIVPLRDFDYRDPFKNPGAIEPFSRVAAFNAGPSIFEHGLANRNLWSNDATVFDTGVNWYPNRYLKFVFDWQYSRYGSPVQVSPIRFTKSENMFLLRTQLFY
jgi:phosphate-selective porin OprO/OprP